MKHVMLICIVLTCSVTHAELPQFDKGPRPKNFNELREYYTSRGLRIVHKKLTTPADVQQTNDVIYSERPGHPLHIDTFVPKKVNATKSVVILVHGGGWKKGNRSGEHTKAAWFSSRGYVAVCPEYRLSGEATFPAAIHDLKDAIRWARSHAAQWGANSNNIILMGFSAGAHLVALAATAGPEAGLDPPDSRKLSSSVAACIAVAGPSITNDERTFRNARAPGSNYQLFFGGLPETIPDVYERASPAHWVSGNEPPMLFITEGNPDAHKTIRSRLDKAGVRNEGFNLTGGIHSEWNWEPWFTPTMEETEKFIRSVFTP